MEHLSYVEIENFKRIGAKLRIPLADPSVLIGPNNSGKTTVLQALSLWGRAVFEWTDLKAKGRLERDGSAVLNRLSILDVPVRETRYLWHDMRLQDECGPIAFTLTAGVRMPEGDVRALCMEFRYHDAESVICRPSDAAQADAALLKRASEIRFGLLHPMSGIASAVSDSTDEPLVAPGRVNVLLGQGQTAQTLRNVCYALWEQSPADWESIARIMERVFRCRLDEPRFDAGRGSLTLTYCELGLNRPLEIALAGRGFQQLLLMLAYLYGRKGQVLLFDEPDAHLEILRQKQAFSILREASDAMRSQIVLATHSEVILDEAIETNLVSIAHAQVAELSLRRDVKTTLRSLGVEHYYKAEQKRRLLIVEGGTDVCMLRAFAAKLAHQALAVLDDTLFSFYTQDVQPVETEGDQIEMLETRGVDYRQYYSTLKRLTPDLRALAIFDSDGHEVKDESVSVDFRILRWRRYELENYFITPERLETFAVTSLGKSVRASAQKVLDELLKEMVFKGDEGMVRDYHVSPAGIRENLLAHTKMSLFAERFFRRLAETAHVSILLNKGQFWRLIDTLKQAEIPAEIAEKLDAIQEMLTLPETASRGLKRKDGSNVALKDALKGAFKCALKQGNANLSDDDLDEYCQIISLMRDNCEITLSAIADALKMGERTVDGLVSKLKAVRAIQRTGGRKAGRWEVLI